MIRKIKTISALLVGVLIGWTFGFFRIPSIHTKDSFISGIFLGAALMGLLLVLFNLRSVKTNNKNWVAASVLILIGSVASILWVFAENSHLKDKLQAQQMLLSEQRQIITSERVQGLSSMMADEINKVKIELDSSTSGSLSDESIQRLEALSHVLEPYLVERGEDTTNQRILSPERGYLLLQLCFLPFDTLTYEKIKMRVTFSQADLAGVNLSGLDLSGLNLEQANLKDAILEGVNLEGANLKETQLWGAKLNNAQLKGADFTRASMNWIEAENANFEHAIINGAMLENSKLNNSIFTNAKIQWAIVRGAQLEGADLYKADLKGSNLNLVRFSNANLSEANLTLTSIEDASFSNANLSETRVMENNWLDLLVEKNVEGASQISKIYSIQLDTTKRAKHLLERTSTEKE